MTALGIAPHRSRAAFGKLLAVEARLYLRTPMSFVWSLVIPVLAVIVIAAMPGTRHPIAAFGGASVLQTYLPIIIGFSTVMSAVNVLPVTLTQYRERGILRRLSTTPVPAYYLLVVQVVLNAVIQVAVALLAVIITGAVGTPLPRQPLGFVVAFLLLAAATGGIGMLITAVCDNMKVAGAVSMLAFFVLMFFSGLWIPRATMPGWLRHISDATPLGAGVQALQDSAAGTWPTLLHLAVLAAYAAVCGVVAARLFRWE